MTGRVYTVTGSKLTFTNAGGDADLVEISVADDKPVEIMGWTIDVTSEVGDAAEEMIAYKWGRGHATSGSGGNAPTPAPVSTPDTAAGFTAETNNTTIASAGTNVDLYAGGFNERAGEKVFLPPEFRFGAAQGSTLIYLRLLDTVADDVTISFTVWVKELF
jgi:hypothetical protein